MVEKPVQLSTDANKVTTRSSIISGSPHQMGWRCIGCSQLFQTRIGLSNHRRTCQSYKPAIARALREHVGDSRQHEEQAALARMPVQELVEDQPTASGMEVDIEHPEVRHCSSKIVHKEAHLQSSTSPTLSCNIVHLAVLPAIQDFQRRTSIFFLPCLARSPSPIFSSPPMQMSLKTRPFAPPVLPLASHPLLATWMQHTLLHQMNLVSIANIYVVFHHTTRMNSAA